MTGRMVVVETVLSIESRQDAAMFAARLDLGLTGYGRTEAEAKSSVKDLFNRWVNAYRRKGLLEERLTDIGADWCWLDEYAGGLPVEDTAAAAPQSEQASGTASKGVQKRPATPAPSGGAMAIAA